MKTKKRSKIKVVARFIMSFILTLAIVCFVLLHILSSTILSKKYMMNSLEKVDYYNRVYNLVEENFEKYIQQSGLNKDILKNIVSKEKITEDTKRIIVNIYDGFYEEVSTDSIKEKLKSQIEEDVNRELTDEEKVSVEQYIEEICNEYRLTILYLDYEEKINDMYIKLMEYIGIAQKIAILCIGISAISIILLNRRRLYKIGTNIAIAMLAAGAILVVIYMYITLSLDIRYITILNDPITDLVRNIVYDIFSKIFKYGIISSVIGIITMIISNFVHSITKYKTIMQGKPEEN